MIRCLATVSTALALLAAVPEALAQQGPSPEQVNLAIDQGVAYLRSAQSIDGVWSYSGHDLGMTALGGLALFESQVPKDDPAIVRAEKYVLRHAPSEVQTYDLSLAILFLSRLHPNDRGEIRDLIRQMAWKLAAGEQGGAWSYTNPVNPRFPMPILERSKPPMLASGPSPAGERGGHPGVESGGTASAPGSNPGTAASGREGPSISGLGGLAAGASPSSAPKARDADAEKARKAAEKPGASDDPDEDMPGPEEDDTPAKTEPAKPDAKAKSTPARKSPARNNTKKPNPQAEARARQRQVMALRPYGDHSNTQFGMLGVWVGSQYGYDPRNTLANLNDRFHLVQRADGAWGYRADGSVVHGPEAMTCVGVLALYIAAGNDEGDGRDAISRGQDLEQDRTYRRGLEAVTSYAKKMDRRSATYFLWSLERLCVALGKEKLDGFDWYKAGAQILVDRQEMNGSWNDGQWGRSPDTCLALLFLHRSNLAKGIEKEIRLAEYKDISGLPTLAKRVDPPSGSPEPPAETPPPGMETPVVANPNPAPGDGTDREADDVAMTEPPPSSGADPIDDRGRVEGPSDAETGGVGAAGPFEPRFPIIVVVALLILMSLPALTGRWQPES